MRRQMRIGVFGCGNMGRALVKGISSRFPETQFFLYTPSGIKAQELAREVHGSVIEKVEDMPRDLDWYLLGFKPQSLDDFQFDFNHDSKIISVLAGVSTQKLVSKFNTDMIARLMPNTPSSIGLGANLVFLNSCFSEHEKNELLSILEGCGKIFAMSSEEDLNLVTAFSGSGPALIFEVARIFEAELTRLTEGRVLSKEIVAQTFLGSASLMQSELPFSELRNQVTSKKGVTYEALEVLKEHQLQDIFQKAFMAAYKRTLELSK